MNFWQKSVPILKNAVSLFNISTRGIGGRSKGGNKYKPRPIVKERLIKYTSLVPPNYPIDHRVMFRTHFWLPEKTGDWGMNLNVTPNDFVHGYSKSKEMEDADELVKSMFMLKNNPLRETRILKQQRAMDLVKRHKYDYSSPEVKIAKDSAVIQHMVEILRKKPYSTQHRKITNLVVYRRNKRLRMMRKYDYKLYEWTLEKLNLHYRALEEDMSQVTKKGSIRRRTADLCSKMIQDKLDAYREKLEAEKKVFYKEKLEKLEMIRKIEADIGLPSSVSDEEIEEAKKKMEQHC